MVKFYLICLTCIPSLVRLQGIDFPFASFPACRRDPGKNGWCRDIKDCPPILGNILNIKRSNCGFRGDRPLVCCPLSVDLLKSNKESGVARLKEKLLSPIRSFECGKREVVEPESISDGRNNHATIPLPSTTSPLQTSPSSSNPSRTVPHFKSWPWMVLLVENNESNRKTFFCSGVLINENYVLTAAECVVNRTNLFVRFGGHHNNSKEFNSEQFENLEDIKVEDSILHPNYIVNNNYHGLALLKLSKTQVIRNGVIPVCLPLDREFQEDLVNETVTLISWARDQVDEQPFPLLLEDNATVLDFSVCNESFSDRSDNKEFFLDKMNNNSVLCLDYDATKDFCKGISGGPVMHYRKRDETFTLSGIISNDYGCRSKTLPRIYTSIRNRSTRMWIRDVALT
ncbi:UNVERIFIED_CONTAM: hypothetical protein RMT77_002844 [Armadillidium vulgare]